MPKRKTFSIAQLLHTVNKRNEASTCSSEARQGWNSLLADVLMSADVYSGYNYLGPESVPAGCEPGIAFERGDGSTLQPTEFYERLDAAQQEKLLKGLEVAPKNGDTRVFPDETRRFYYVDASLLEAYGKLEAADREKAKIEADALARTIAAGG